jgi:hypothetical protein
MRQAERWPDIHSVEYTGYAVTLGLFPAWEYTGYTGGLPVAFAAPIAGDGILQLEPGVGITLEYRQPDGSVLVTTLEY